ncbi:MAG: CBS and ACT domain-containing protein [Erysipelotrichaceae bacterium]
MYIKDAMSSEIITISKDVKINEALDIMQSNKFHRLPVVDNGKLIGLITESMILNNSSSQITSLSVHELNYLLSKVTVKDIMLTDVVTIFEDDLIEKAANLMKEYEIGCLPVVDKENNLISIVTVNDIFKAFIDIMGYYEKGVRLEIEVEDNEIGVLEKIAKIFRENQAYISRFSVYSQNDKTLLVIRTTKEDTNNIEKQLSGVGYKVLKKHINKNN